MMESNESLCPWSFNQSDVVDCESFVYLTHEHILLNEVMIQIKLLFEAGLFNLQDYHVKQADHIVLC